MKALLALMERFTRGRASSDGPRMTGLLSGLAPAMSAREIALSATRAQAGGQG